MQIYPLSKDQQYLDMEYLSQIYSYIKYSNYSISLNAIKVELKITNHKIKLTQGHHVLSIQQGHHVLSIQPLHGIEIAFVILV